jgi:hypothetical protein
MTLAVYRVPEHWRHPTDADGDFLRMEERFPYNPAEVAEGLREGWLCGHPPYYNVPVMPPWPAHERTHWQLYDASTGTPISPVCATVEALAQWAVDHGDMVFADVRLGFSQWLAFLHRLDPRRKEEDDGRL